MEFDDEPRLNLKPCSFCKRNFAIENLKRHEGICQKTSRKRPVFDSSKQRVVNAGPAKLQPKKHSISSRNIPTTSKPSHQSNWRQKHEEFIRTVRGAREVTLAMKEGRQLPPPPPPTINPDYIQCPHCLRRFSETAAERHISFCAEQAKRLSNKKPGTSNITSQASHRANARLKYRPPSLPSKKTNELGITTSAPNHFTKARSSATNQNFQKTMSDKSYEQSSQQRLHATVPDWDSSVDVNAGTSEVRSKTGLRPSSGVKVASAKSKSSKYLSSNLQQKPTKAIVRKVANKRVSSSGNTKFHSNTYEQTCHDWSPECESSNSEEDLKYTASAYQSSNASRYQLMNGSKKTNEVFKGSVRNHHSANRRVAAKKLETKDKGMKSRYQNPISKQEDFYNWLEPDKQMLHSQLSMPGELTDFTRHSSKFCHECGSRYPIVNARFCCECGVKRLVLN